MKGAILYASSSFRESLEAYEKALELNPELKTALEMSSKIRKQLKMPNRSVATGN
jgi:tetratricopeptide (TPR) repeat protein